MLDNKHLIKLYIRTAHGYQQYPYIAATDLLLQLKERSNSWSTFYENVKIAKVNVYCSDK